MSNYKRIELDFIDDKVIDKIYDELLSNKWHFVIINIKNKLKVLTKEKSLFDIDNEHEFLNFYLSDVYYKTQIIEGCEDVNKTDLDLYYKHINKFKRSLEKNIYGGKYLFGSVAVKTTNGFITTIRGKENLKDFTVVYNVNHKDHIVSVANKKATLNAPLLHYIFDKNKNIKIIVHLNGEFDNSLPTLEYAFPGTKKDSIRNINTSFNIRHHGLVYLFNEKGKLIKEEKL